MVLKTKVQFKDSNNKKTCYCTKYIGQIFKKLLGIPFLAQIMKSQEKYPVSITDIYVSNIQEISRDILFLAQIVKSFLSQEKCPISTP